MSKVMVFVALLSGCSLALQDRPRHASTPACQPSKVWPILDAIGVVGSLAAVSYAIAKNDDDTGLILGATGAMTAVGYTASLGNGLKWSRECRSGGAATMTAAR